MAVLFTYPLKSTLSPNDLALISNSEDGNKTNNATMTSIKDVIDVVDSITATSPIVASSLTGGVNISSIPYSGGNNLGHVPSGGTVDTFLRGDGNWGSSPIPLASITTRGGVKIDPNPMSGKNYPVLLSNERAYVNVPWTGTNFTAGTGLTLTGTVFSANTVGTQSNLANVASSVAGRSYPIQTGAASGTVGSDHLIVNIPWTDTTPLASSAVVGGFKLLNNTDGTTPTTLYTTADRNYAIQKDSSGRAMVNVPWTNEVKLTLTTRGSTGPAELIGSNLNIPEYTASSGTVSSITATPASYQGKEYVSISNLSSAVGNVNLGFVGLTATALTTVPDPGSVDCRFLIKDNYWASLWPASVNFLGGIALSSATVQTVAPNAVSSTASKTYSVQLDANNKAVVNVPWTGGSGTSLQIKNQDAAFALKTSVINFKDNDYGRITASTSDQGTNVDVTTIPYSGFSPLPIYQNNSQTAGTFISIGYYVVQDLLNVNQVAFTGTNSSPDELPAVSVAIYQVDDSLGITSLDASLSAAGPLAVFDYVDDGTSAETTRLRVASYDALKSTGVGTTYQGRPGEKVIVCMSAKNINVDSSASIARLKPNFFRYADEVYTNFQTIDGIEIKPLPFNDLMGLAKGVDGAGISMPGMQFYFGFKPIAAK